MGRANNIDELRSTSNSSLINQRKSLSGKREDTSQIMSILIFSSLCLSSVNEHRKDNNGL